MLNRKNKILLIAVVILFALLIISGIFFKPAPATTIPQTKTYKNDFFGFSLEYPSRLTVTTEKDGSVTFADDSVGPWVLVVSVAATPDTSTKTWLEAQSKGSATSAGYEPILWLGNDTALLAKCDISDYDGKRPIYNEEPVAVHVENGMLYMIKYRNYVALGETPFIEPDIMAAIASFRATEPQAEGLKK